MLSSYPGEEDHETWPTARSFETVPHISWIRVFARPLQAPARATLAALSVRVRREGLRRLHPSFSDKMRRCRPQRQT